MSERQITITLTVNELDLVMRGLDHLAHGLARPVVDRILRQVNQTDQCVSDGEQPDVL